jgi:hypothetical protein
MYQSEGGETMSGSLSTPGPWVADGYDVRQSGSNGSRKVAMVCYTGPHHTSAKEYPKSCRLQDEANARLIAAAPDLYHALWLARSYAYKTGMSTAYPHEWEKMNQALAKAKGEL